MRDRLFRRRVVTAYDARCAITGLKLINGGGRAEVEAAHIRPVDRGGPDIVTNGIALSGTVHWMFDRGLIGLGDDLGILVSRQANDQDGIRGMINRSGFALSPLRALDRPHPACQSASKRDPLSACKRGPVGGVALGLITAADFWLGLA